MVIPLARLGPSAALKERQLQGLVGEGSAVPESALRDLADAQLLGSLELSGFAISWDEITADRNGAPVPEAAAVLRAASRAVNPAAAFSVEALETWQRALFGASVYRDEAVGPGAARLLADWMVAPSARSLSPARQGALVLARLVEIRPFGPGTGRLSRLAASHVMVGAGARPPILVGADRERLDAALREAMSLATESLVALLDEASGRAVDVLLQSLRRDPAVPS